MPQDLPSPQSRFGPSAIEVLDERTVPAISLFDPRVVDLGAMQREYMSNSQPRRTGVRVLGNGLLRIRDRSLLTFRLTALQPVFTERLWE